MFILTKQKKRKVYIRIGDEMAIPDKNKQRVSGQFKYLFSALFSNKLELPVPGNFLSNDN